ncbi:MAG: hypothetical protein AB1768_15295 [Pseudomonadota bacterium]|jgi:hypothetical protein
MRLSQRQFAEHKGVSPTAVRKAIARGEITTEPDGGIDLAKNGHWQPRVGINQSDRGWAQGPSSPSEREADRPTGIPDYAKSRAIREAYAARLAKLEFEERAGKLVSADEVKVEQFHIARALRDRLLQLPAKLAPQIVAIVVAEPDVAAVEEALETELRELLSEFVPSL